VRVTRAPSFGLRDAQLSLVIPAKAGIQLTVTSRAADWIPACAGMTLFPPARE
jgi:hypothetical protein